MKDVYRVRRSPAALVAALAAGLMMGACSVVGGKAAEEPPFTLIAEDGDFAIREYGALTVARTVVAAPDRGEAVSAGFRRLFRYIDGGNSGSAKIAMTAPVMTRPDDGDKIAMTAPVLTEPAGEGAWETVFVLPEGMTEATAPAPSDPTVEIATIPARQVAVVRFSGFLGEGAIERERDRLDAWLSDRGQAHLGDWRAAGYNPPWTVPAFRRNEVMVTLEDVGG